MSRHVRGGHAAQGRSMESRSGQGWELTCPEAGSGVGASVRRRWLPNTSGPVPRRHEGDFTLSLSPGLFVRHQRVREQGAGS